MSCPLGRRVVYWSHGFQTVEKSESLDVVQAGDGGLDGQRVRGVGRGVVQLSAENRRFLEGRLIPPSLVDVAADVRATLKKKLSTRAVYSDQFSHAEIKRLIDGFAKAVIDPAAVAGVLVTDIGLSCETFAKVGDFEEIVDHVYATMNRLEGVLKELDPADARPIIEQLCTVAERWKGRFGYGLSDELFAMAMQWRDRVR